MNTKAYNRPKLGQTMIHHSKLGLSGMVLKKKRELVLEKESTMKISTKRKGVCGTQREGDR